MQPCSTENQREIRAHELRRRGTANGKQGGDWRTAAINGERTMAAHPQRTFEAWRIADPSLRSWEGGAARAMAEPARTCARDDDKGDCGVRVSKQSRQQPPTRVQNAPAMPASPSSRRSRSPTGRARNTTSALAAVGPVSDHMKRPHGPASKGAPRVTATARPSRAPTDVSNPQYYHKVVDCQWACPAHTNVPEYIRLIAQGRYTDSYMLNRESNVFPGILGRTCDRPCEPACRRGRVDGKPVAICRLKRVAADHRDDITRLLPKAPAAEERQARRADRRGPGVADGRERSDAARLRGRDLREARRAGRADAHQHPLLPSAREGARRRSRQDPRHGRRRPVQHAGDEHEALAGRGVRRGVRRQRRAEGQGARHPRPHGSRGRTSTSASSGWRRRTSGTSRRSASGC